MTKSLSSSSSSRAKQVILLRREAKFWKERYLVEKKCRQNLIHWISGVFGFAVNVEVDKATLTIKIEGNADPDTMPHAAIAIPLADAENKTLLMEEKLTMDEGLSEDTEEMESLKAELAEVEVEISNSRAAKTLAAQQIQLHYQSPAEEVEVLSSSSDCQPQIDPRTSVVDVTGPEGESLNVNDHIVFDLLKGYEEFNSTSQSQPSYIILKTPDTGNAGGGEGLGLQQQPLQIDLSQFINPADLANADSTILVQQGSGEGQQESFIYRVADLNENVENFPYPWRSYADNNLSDLHIDSDLLLDPSSHFVIGTFPATTTSSSSSSRTMLNKASSTARHKVRNNAASHSPKKMQKLLEGGSGTTKKLEEQERHVNKLSSDFGLTLRERAEVFVQQQALEAVEKRSHRGDYTCKACTNDYTFSSIENALTHTRTHYEGKPYKCGDCNEMFALQKQFLQHKKLHTPLKRIAATNVKKSYNTPNFKTAPLAIVSTSTLT